MPQQIIPAKFPNASKSLGEDFVEVMARFQGLERDLKTLQKHLSDPITRSGVGARVLACSLSCAVLQEWITRMQITAVSE